MSTRLENTEDAGWSGSFAALSPGASTARHRVYGGAGADAETDERTSSLEIPPAPPDYHEDRIAPRLRRPETDSVELHDRVDGAPVETTSTDKPMLVDPCTPLGKSTAPRRAEVGHRSERNVAVRDEMHGAQIQASNHRTDWECDSVPTTVLLLATEKFFDIKIQI